MSKRTGLYIFIGCITPIIIIGVIYVGLAYYYSEGFTYGLWINGIYSTGKSVETINNELLAQETTYQLEIIDINNKSYLVSGEDISFNVDYTESLNEIMKRQNSFLWGTKLVKQDYRTIPPVVTYNEDELDLLISQFDFMKENIYDEKNSVSIEKTENGYVINDSTKNLLVPEKAKILIHDALNEQKNLIDLAEGHCYEDLPIQQFYEEQYELYAKLTDFQDFTITYKLGEDTEVVGPGEVCEWILLDDNGEIAFDENGNLQADENKIREFINGLGEKYDTLNQTREFKSTRGDIITIDGGTYGNDINEEVEYEFLKEAFLSDATGQTREPEYLVKAKSQGTDDIGGTYIEVDMTLQHLYYYEDYDIALDTPVVTGNLRTKCGTPVKVCYVYYKQKNRTLRGANYASFVYYWMAVYKNIGIHDATWRDSFGGEIYKTSGSHGCINIPKKKAAELYDMVEKGTPVIIFY